MMGKILPEMGKLADREMVRGGIDLQQTRHELQGSSNPGSNPHKGLKDIIPENNLLRAMRYIYILTTNGVHLQSISYMDRMVQFVVHQTAILSIVT